MMLPFKTRFALPILAGKKIHTIRHGHRWCAGLKIHMAIYNRTSKVVVFNKHRPDLSRCISTQSIQVRVVPDATLVYVDGRLLTDQQLDQLAANDGLVNAKGFGTWFTEDFDGQIIHWTRFRY